MENKSRTFIDFALAYKQWQDQVAIEAYTKYANESYFTSEQARQRDIKEFSQTPSLAVVSLTEEQMDQLGKKVKQGTKLIEALCKELTDVQSFKNEIKTPEEGSAVHHFFERFIPINDNTMMLAKEMAPARVVIVERIRAGGPYSTWEVKPFEPKRTKELTEEQLAERVPLRRGPKPKSETVDRLKLSQTQLNDVSALMMRVNKKTQEEQDVLTTTQPAEVGQKINEAASGGSEAVKKTSTVAKSALPNLGKKFKPEDQLPLFPELGNPMPQVQEQEKSIKAARVPKSGK